MDTTLSTWDVLGIAAQFYVARIVQGTTFHMIFTFKKHRILFNDFERSKLYFDVDFCI